jgi:hypothetical protein
MINRQIVEALSWGIVAEMKRRYPQRLWVRHWYFGNGHYDLLTLHLVERTKTTTQVDLNRHGGVRFVTPESTERTWQKFWTSMIRAQGLSRRYSQALASYRPTRRAHPSTDGSGHPHRSGDCRPHRNGGVR